MSDLNILILLPGSANNRLAQYTNDAGSMTHVSSINSTIQRSRTTLSSS
jgi:hypothetical protein